MNKSKLENGEVIEAFREKYGVSDEDLQEDLLGDKWMPVYIKDMEQFITNALNQQREELIEDLGEYITHTRECVTTGYSAGRPTKDGYEVKIGGKWYQSRPIDKTPKCDCGLIEFLTKLEK